MIKDLIKQYAVLLGSVLALALLAGACYLTYVVTDNHWSAKYSGLEQKYSDASAKATQEARVKEWEYQTMLMQSHSKGLKTSHKLALTLIVPMLLLVGCSNGSTVYLPTPAPKIPALPKEARQPEKPSICLPTCSKNLSNETDSWLTTPTKPVVLDPPVKKPTTPSNQASNTKLVYFV